MGSVLAIGGAAVLGGLMPWRRKILKALAGPTASPQIVSSEANWS